MLCNYKPTTFPYRLLNTLLQLAVAASNRLLSNGGQYLLAEYALDIQSWRELASQAKLFFVSRDYVLNRPQPYFPNVIPVPSLTYSSAKALPSEFEQVYASAANGVVVFSFGSVTRSINKAAMDNLFAAFRQLHETVITKVAKQTT